MEQPASVHIVCYTDPLCSWSWASEPQWRRLRWEFGDQVQWTYRMAGMLPDWHTYEDPINSVGRPAQMGPLWFQVRHTTGMPINERIWYADPPGSSFPACIAVKAAERQGAAAGEQYLRRLREAVMLEGRNIARQDILLAIAREQSASHAETLDFAQFTGDLAGPDAVEAFRADVQDAAYRGIGRFPTLILHGSQPQNVMVTGYRLYAMLLEALAAAAPDLAPLRTGPTAEAYATYWGRITPRELAEAMEVPVDEAARQLYALQTQTLQTE